MKRALKIILVSLGALTYTPVFAASVIDYPAGVAASGIAGTRHNMGAFGKVFNTPSTTEICVFCHTPHHSNTAYGLKPMWNRGTAAPSTYTAYGATIGGSTINNNDIGSTSLACLSCHDGVTTFDNIVNAPGKGGVVNGGSDRGWAFRMPGFGSDLDTYLLNATDHFNLNYLSPVGCRMCHSGPQGLSLITRLTIGTDLSNDHPVSVSYNTDRAGLRPTNTTINSIDLTSELLSSAASAYNGNLSQNRWAVKGFISDTATISDLLRDGKVECSSCHDPHFNNLSWDEAESTWADGYDWCGNIGEACTDGNFLRRVGGNTGSGVCRTCHQK